MKAHLFLALIVLLATHHTFAQDDVEISLDCDPTHIQLFFGNEYMYFGAPNNRGEPAAILTWRTHDTCSGMTLKIEGAKGRHVGDFKSRVETFSANLTSGTEISYITHTHVVELPEIAKEETYTARIYLSIGGGPMTTFLFKLPRKGGKEKEGVELLVVGNLGVGAAAKETIDDLSRRISREHSKLSGMIDLGNSFLKLEGDNGHFNDQYFAQLDPIDYLLPTIVIANEENTQEGLQIYQSVARNPNYLKTSNYYFSVNIGHLHIIHYNIDHYAQLTQDGKKEMINWIKNDLKMANQRRQDFPWIVVVAHHSLYCSYDEQDGESSVHCHKLYFERQFWDELHHIGGVDLHISAEVPTYERSHGLYKNSIKTGNHFAYNKTFTEPNSTIYIVEGAAGEVIEQTQKKYKLEDYTLEAHPGSGYGILSNPDKNTLIYEHINSKTGLSIDSVTIRKGVKQPDMGSFYLIYIAIGLVGWYFYTSKKNREANIRKDRQRANDQEIPLVERS